MSKIKKQYLSYEDALEIFKNMVDRCSSVPEMENELNNCPHYDGPGDQIFSWGGFYLYHGQIPFGVNPQYWPLIKTICHEFFDRANAAAKSNSLDKNDN